MFDVSDNLYLIQCAEGRELRREKTILQQQDLFRRAKEVVNLEIQVLICGAISYPLERTLAAAGVRVIGFTCGDLEEVIGAFFNGSLTQPCFRMPGWTPREKGAGGCHRLRRNRGRRKWEITERG